MSRVLVLWCGPDLAHIRRVIRQVNFLAEEFDVVLAASTRPDSIDPSVEFLALEQEPLSRARRVVESVGRVALRRGGRYANAYWLDSGVRRMRARLAEALPVDAAVVNELTALPLARALSDRLPIVFDSHEHWTSESASWNRFQRFTMRDAHDWVVDRFVPGCAGVMTVSRGIADDYEARLGIRPALVTNAPLRTDVDPSPVDDPIRLIHIGLADERRRIEDTIEAVSGLGERFTLDLVLMHENAYRRRLERMADAHEHIRILLPVAAEDVIPFANGYDVGVHLLPARFPNHIHNLPNKLFEYIQARLAVAIGPNREMAEIVREWRCGVVSPSFSVEDFAATLDGLTPDAIAEMKQRSEAAAKVLNGEANRDTIVQLVKHAAGD